jgi:hypothetical protein
MFTRINAALVAAIVLLAMSLLMLPANACCPAGHSGMPVVNADQSVIILWDAATQTEHFIRRASFKSDGDDFGFLIPSPSQPELNESGNDAFPYLQKLTEPKVITKPRPSEGISCGCSGAKTSTYGLAGGPSRSHVTVLDEKFVAGFKATVLETKSTDALLDWLKANDYAYSPEVKDWAKPYVESGWKITALKVAKDKEGKENKNVAAAALRMSFKTDRPLFPYREPDTRKDSATLGATSRLLRIYFIGEARYEGQLTREKPWSGKVAWSKKLSDEARTKTLESLKLPATTGPAQWWLTEFEDRWPYEVAPADVTFSRSVNQDTVERKPIIQYVSASWPGDVTIYAMAAVVILPPFLRRLRGGRAS